MEDNESIPGIGSQVLSDICDLPALDDDICLVLDDLERRQCFRTGSDGILRQQQGDRDKTTSDSCDASVLSWEPDDRLDQKKHPRFFLAIAKQRMVIRKAKPRRARPRKPIRFRVLPTSRPKNMYTLPQKSVEILECWIAHHSDHPYPSPAEREELTAQTNMTSKQIQNWLSSTRYKRGIQKPHKKRHPT